MGVDELLAGPRGRRLCSELAVRGAYVGIPSDEALITSEVSRQVDAVLAGPDPEAAIFAALSASVLEARYWQDPDEDDVLLADPHLAGLFAPLAEVVVMQVSTRWWSTGIDRATQVYTMSDWTTLPFSPGKPMVDALVELRARTVEGNNRMREQRRVGGEDRWAMTSGTWWTPPSMVVRHTARNLAGFGPVELSLQEDAPDYDRARSWPVSVPVDARVFGIEDATAWAELVARYPIDVTFGRGANWLQATGRDGRWLIPDWAGVSADYDAVHLPVAAYLSSSGRVINLDADTATFIAGWDPDATYWLSDVHVVEEEARSWARNSNDLWEPVA